MLMVQIKEEAARRRAIKEARKKQTNLGASLLSKPVTGDAGVRDSVTNQTGRARTVSTSDISRERSMTEDGDFIIDRLSLADDGGLRTSVSEQGGAYSSQEYSLELQERDDMLVERDLEIESLKETISTLRDDVVTLSKANQHAAAQADHKSELVIQESVRLLQNQYRLVANMAAKLSRYESAAAAAAARSSEAGVKCQQDSSEATSIDSLAAGPTSNLSHISTDMPTLSADALVMKERDAALVESRKLRFRLDDQEVVWKVRMEAAQEDLGAVKNLLGSKELALEIVMKERDNALAEVQSLKQAIAQMFDSMSDPCSPSPVHKPSIADELEAYSRYGNDSGKKGKSPQPSSVSSKASKTARSSPKNTPISSSGAIAEDDENQWISRIDQVERQLEQATRRRSVREEQVDSIIEDLNKEKKSGNMSLDQKVAQRRMSQQLEQGSVMGMSEQVTHRMSSFNTPPPNDEATPVSTSVVSAWNASAEMSSARSEVSSEYMGEAGDGASVSDKGDASSSTSGQVSGQEHGTDQDRWAPRVKKPQRRLSVEESHAKLSELEGRLQRLQKRPSLMSDAVGVNIEAQSMVYEAMVVTAEERNEVVLYKIVVRALGSIEWTIFRRYSEFRDLYEQIYSMTELTIGEKIVLISHALLN